jgi:hypothetical protein
MIPVQKRLGIADLEVGGVTQVDPRIMQPLTHGVDPDLVGLQ